MRVYLKPRPNDRNVNVTYRNIVGRSMLRAFGHRVAMCCDMLGVVGSNLKMVKFEPTTPNMSQHGGQTHATCCAQHCCDMLRWHVAIVWPGLKGLISALLPTRKQSQHCDMNITESK